MTKVKAKQEIKSLDFRGEGSAVALVGPSVGSAANGFKTLITKAEDTTDSNIEAVLEAIQVKVRKKRTKESEPAVAPVVTTESDNSTTNASVEKQVEPSGSVTKSKGELMTEKVEEVQEVVNDALVEVQKALGEQKAQAEASKVELQKALAQIEEFKAIQKQAIVKAKTDKVAAVIKNVEHQAIIAKASLELESEEDFGAFMAAMTAMQAQVSASEMFVEKGLQSSVDKPAVTPQDKVLAVVKARQAVQAK
jgi:hypothetical protein